MNTIMNVRMNRVVALMVAMLITPSAWAEAGRAMFVAGAANVERAGETLPLTKGSAVEAGDVVVTAEDGRVQLKMADGSRIAVRPSSRFLIETFQLAAPAGDESEPVEGKSVYQLLKGGFRTVTGAIGKEDAKRDEGDERSYEVRTSVATIGIRGTVYSASFGDPAECKNAWGTDAPNAGKDGALYVGVASGEVVLINGAGEFETPQGRFVCIMDFDVAPIAVPEIPTIISSPTPKLPPRRAPDPQSPNRPDGQPNSGPGSNAGPGSGAGPTSGGGPGGGLSGGPTRGDNEFGPETPTGGPPPVSSEPDIPVDAEQPLDNGGTQSSEVAVAIGNIGGQNGAPLTTSGRSEQGNTSRGSDDALEGFRAPGLNGQGNDFAIGGAPSVNQGFDRRTGLRWGRWASGSANPVDGGAGSDVDDLHWITSSPQFDQPAIPSSGSRSYVLIGNTNPTDNRGNAGVLGGATLDANFDNQTVDTTLDISIGGETWSASGQGDIGGDRPNGFSGDYDNVTVDGQGGGDGRFDGFFTDDADAAGLGYTLSSPDDETDVQGVAGFEAVP